MAAMRSIPLNFSGNIPQNYEDFLGPFLFEPFALDLLERLDFTGVKNILELACGSGRLTKHIAAWLPENVLFTSSDLSEEMIQVAKAKVDTQRVNWATVDMMDIPYQDNVFDLIVCQFGIMLVPDQHKALKEIFRVLKPNGKIIFNTWADIDDNKLWSIGNSVLDSILKQQPLAANPGPFSMSDGNSVLMRLKDAGFNNCTLTSVEKFGEIETAAMAARGFIHGLPILSFILKQDPDMLIPIVLSLEEELRNQLGEHPLIVQQSAFIFEGIKNI